MMRHTTKYIYGANELCELLGRNWEEQAKIPQDSVSVAKQIKSTVGPNGLTSNNVLCHAGDTLKWLDKRQKDWTIIMHMKNWVELDPDCDEQH